MINIVQFNWFDYVLTVLILLSVILGFKQGFFKGLISVLIWLAILVVPLLFADHLAIYFVGFTRSASWAYFFSFIILAFVTLVVGSILYLIIRLATGTSFNIVSSLFGAIFGFARGLLIVTLFVAVVSTVNFYQYKWFRRSQLIDFSQTILSCVQQHTAKITKKMD